MEVEQLRIFYSAKVERLISVMKDLVNEVKLLIYHYHSNLCSSFAQGNRHISLGKRSCDSYQRVRQHSCAPNTKGLCEFWVSPEET